MTVLHISFDYPDKIDSRKTKAIRNLVNCQNHTKNIVFSLNRTAAKWKVSEVIREEHGYTLYVFGLPYGILLYFWMFIAYRRILKIIRTEGLNPDLIHAHKLTFEGIIASLLSAKLKVPFIVSIRSADFHVFRYKKLSLRFFGQILQNAQKVLFIAPWAVKPLKKILGEKVIRGKYEVLPNIVNCTLDDISEKEVSKKFLTVFHFKFYKVKNISRLIRAFDQVFKKYPDYGLDIVGTGPNKEKILADISRTSRPENFTLKGEMENSEVRKMYRNYLGFVLPSNPETFGLVFIEALSAGIPIIYSKNAGIDGFFNDLGVGISVDHQSVNEIAQAIEKVIEHNKEYRQNVRRMVSEGLLDQFSADTVSQRYIKIVLPQLVAEPQVL